MNKKWLIFNIFCSAIFLQIIPNVNTLGSNNILFTSNFLSLSLIILTGIFLYFTDHFKSLYKHRVESILVLIFFISQGISIINALTLAPFIIIFTNITVGVTIYFITKNLIYEGTNNEYISKTRSLNTTIILGGAINIACQILLLIYPAFFSQIIDQFFSKNLMEVTKLHYENKKLYSNFVIEIIIPILSFNFIISNKTKGKIFSFFLVVVVFIMSFLSNFRYRLLGSLFALSFSLIVFRAHFRKFNWRPLVYILILFSIFSIFLTSLPIDTTLNRFIDTKEYGKYGTIAFRFMMQEKAIELGSSNIVGVGLGNMYDYLQKSPKQNNSFMKESSNYALIGGTHNIFFQTFAETGLFGLLSLLILIIFWLLKDIKSLNKVNDRKKVYIPMFWTLILISQFIPFLWSSNNSFALNNLP